MQFDPFVDVEIVSPLRDVHNFLYSKSLALTDPGSDAWTIPSFAGRITSVIIYLLRNLCVLEKSTRPAATR